MLGYCTTVHHSKERDGETDDRICMLYQVTLQWQRGVTLISEYLHKTDIFGVSKNCIMQSKKFALRQLNFPNPVILSILTTESSKSIKSPERF